MGLIPIDEFAGYLTDIYTHVRPVDPLWEQKVKTVLARFADTAVGVAASSLLNKDTVIKDMDNKELADAMQRHVRFRSGGKTEAKLPNSAWSMMLEAAERLKELDTENTGLHANLNAYKKGILK